MPSIPSKINVCVASIIIWWTADRRLFILSGRWQICGRSPHPASSSPEKSNEMLKENSRRLTNGVDYSLLMELNLRSNRFHWRRQTYCRLRGRRKQQDLAAGPCTPPSPNPATPHTSHRRPSPLKTKSARERERERVHNLDHTIRSRRTDSSRVPCRCGYCGSKCCMLLPTRQACRHWRTTYWVAAVALARGCFSRRQMTHVRRGSSITKAAMNTANLALLVGRTSCTSDESDDRVRADTCAQTKNEQRRSSLAAIRHIVFGRISGCMAEWLPPGGLVAGGRKETAMSEPT